MNPQNHSHFIWRSACDVVEVEMKVMKVIQELENKNQDINRRLRNNNEDETLEDEIRINQQLIARKRRRKVLTCLTTINLKVLTHLTTINLIGNVVNIFHVRCSPSFNRLIINLEIYIYIIPSYTYIS